MTMRMKQWVKLPTGWIESGGLKKLRWMKDVGSSNVAGLMVYGVIAHHADDKGRAERLTYDNLTAATGLSRTKVSNGLNVLYEMELITKESQKQSLYSLVDYNPEKGWGKFPARGLYQGKRIPAFHVMHLRKNTELDALKLYYAVVSRRDRVSNIAHMNYHTIERYTGIPRIRIRSAISLLVANNLLHVDHLKRHGNGIGMSNAYRLVHIDTNRHMGTTGRSHLDGMPYEDG